MAESQGLTPHQYADDTQIYDSFSPSHVDDLSSTLSGCVNDVADWVQTNRLQLNPGKTELLWSRLEDTRTLKWNTLSYLRIFQKIEYAHDTFNTLN